MRSSLNVQPDKDGGQLDGQAWREVNLTANCQKWNGEGCLCWPLYNLMNFSYPMS
jgi:hypothetical protein